jgi:hypothetical protein
MTTLTRTRKLGFFIVAIALAASACSATETVTINEATVARATSTAQRDNASAATPADINAGADPATPDDPQESDDGRTSTPDVPRTDEPEGSDSGTTTSDPTPDGDQTCRFDFVDDFGDIQIELIFTNSLPDQDDARASYEVYDGNGALLVESSIFFEELAPSERVRVAEDTLTDEPSDRDASAGITCKLVSIEATPFGLDKVAPSPADNCVFREVDSFGDVQIQINVVNPFTETVELAVDYVLRGPDGVRFGDSVTFTEAVAAGEQSTTEEDTFTDLPDWVPESTFTCAILSIEEF